MRLVGSYNHLVVALSILIAVLSSYVGLNLAAQVTAARRKAGTAWLAAGTISMGIAVWSMHFTAMFAFQLPVPIRYHVPTVLLSFFIATLASGAVLVLLTGERFGRRELGIGSLINAGGIVGLHYTGMASMRLSATCHYRPLIVGLSALIAIVGSLLSLWLTFRHRQGTFGVTWTKVTSALAMGAAISLMHYTGMASATFFASPAAEFYPHTVSITLLGLVSVIVSTLLVLAFSFISTLIAHRLERARALARVNEALRSEIAERQRVETVLREREERIHAILENSPNIIFLKDREGRYLLVNRKFEEALRVSQEQIKGKTDNEVFPSEQAAAFRANDLEVLRAGVPMEFEEIAVHADGPHTSIVQKFPLFDAHREIYAMGGIVTDITERKRAEEARRQSEEQYRIVVKTATDAIISIDEDSQILFVNPATTQIFGYESSELIGRPLTMLMPEFLRPLHRAGLQGYLATGQRHMHWQGVELIGLRENGEQFPAEVSFGEVVIQGRHIFTGFIRDITERKQAEAQLRQLSGRLLRSQDEERRRIAQDLHDATGQDLVALATMLGQLRGLIPSVERKSRRLLSECKALADRCVREVRTLSYLLHPPVLDEAGLEDAIRDYVDGFTRRSGIQVELELPPSTGRLQRDVELALFRVVQEALANVHRHSGSQQAKIRIDRNSDLKLEISDRGRGASASVPRGDEEPRFRVGVGIASMQERVKLIGGRLEIEPTSHGTTVRVTIPLGEERT
jgi:PAS domain S-box-containing protein